jgi:hypothetical protein
MPTPTQSAGVARRRSRISRSRIVSRWLPSTLALALIGVAFWFGLQTTRGLAFPGMDWTGVGIDLYRDISSAQTMLDAGYGPDPTYAGERTWYNPLTPAISAAVSTLTGRPVHSVVTQIGAYANLLAPLAFFLMCAALFDSWTALFATAGFLFLLPASLPSWISATYSPWFLPVNFVQSLFYLTVMALHRAWRSRRTGDFVLAGVAWGATFLGHTAPALVLGGMTTIWAAVMLWRARGGRVVRDARLQPKGIAIRYGLMVVLAIVISLPFLAIIAGHYGLRIKNPDPSAYSEPLLSRELPTLVKLHVTVPMLITVAGLVALVRRKSHGVSRLLVLSWIASAALFLAYSFVRLGGKAVGVTLPSIVPSFHFFFYLKAASAVLFGLGLMAIGKMWAARIGARRGRGPVLSRRARLDSARVRAAAIGLILLGVQAPAYQARSDFGEARAEALMYSSSPQIQVFTWLREHAGQRDVVLTTDEDAATLVASSGAKVVAIFSGFSNPYVDLERRRVARDHMFEALDRGDDAAFRGLAKQYGVTYVLTITPRSEAFDAAPRGDLELVLRAGSRRLYRVRTPATPDGSPSAHLPQRGS